MKSDGLLVVGKGKNEKFNKDMMITILSQDMDRCLGTGHKGASWGQLEQQLEQLARRQPEQQQSDEHEQQYRLPVRFRPKNVSQKPGALDLRMQS